MQRICFATNNSNKIKEISSQLNGQFEVISLADLECTIDLPENQATLKGNAEEKATYIWEHYKTPCFADDTGLEIEALNGEPGVYSARYAGDARDNEANISLVLQNLKTATNRRAQFTTVICHIDSQGKKHFFEGVAKGTIRTERSGKEGFGY
ncbi:MAG: non-canonical purine NTP pyrophosphatase, partial [Cyclobacteriaceae bacterium]